MPNSDELLALVKSAKEFESQKKLKDAKHGFLDAATLALQISKSSSKTDKLSYEIIARELIKYAKELQLEILLESQGLPVPPGITSGEKQKLEQQKVQIPRKIKEIKIFQLMVIKAGGTPLISYEFEELPENTKLKLNEILFTGAITAVSNLMQEVMEKAIQTIRFEGGVLMIHNEKRLQFILFAKEEDEVLFKYLRKFANDFCAIFRDEINDAARTGMTIPVDRKFEKLATGIFKISIV